MIVFNTIVGIISLVLAIIAVCLTFYYSIQNPAIRFKKYLENSQNWKKFETTEDYLSIFRYKKYLNFQIRVDWSNPVVKNFKEEWIKDYPDKENTSYFVELIADNISLKSELFVLLDGGEIFVPVPEREIKDSKTTYFYNSRQIKLSDIIGKYYSHKDIKEFAAQQKIPILIKDQK